MITESELVVRVWYDDGEDEDGTCPGGQYQFIRSSNREVTFVDPNGAEVCLPGDVLLAFAEQLPGAE